ncbi:MAG: hypothetical protein HY001_03895, partial [Candidatus Portnoybacteria bacterium]|nr:hypothetical protein [Candidatus Portnoybacteria bacterium]
GTLINELAQNANPVGLKEECVMQPLVVRVQSGSALVFRNNDAVAHQIIIDKEPITVPAGKEGKVIASFQHGKGFYTTACYEVGADGNVLVESERFIGVLVVE